MGFMHVTHEQCNGSEACIECIALRERIEELKRENEQLAAAVEAKRLRYEEAAAEVRRLRRRGYGH